MSGKLISVIIPVYNADSYLDDCIKSLCKQTYDELEILLVNDGSTDNSEAICKSWEMKDERIKLINQVNQGVSVARNKGIECSTGEYIAFIDSDDWVESDYFEKLIKAIEESGADEVICGFYTNFPDKEIKHGHFVGDMVFNGYDEISQIQIQILARNMSRYRDNSGDLVGSPWCKLFRTAFIRNHQLSFIPNLKRSQDLVFNLYALEVAGKVVYIDVPLYHYRIVDSSACNLFSDKILSNVLAYLREMRRFINKNHNGNVIFEEAFAIKACTSINKCLVQYFFNHQYRGSFGQAKKELKMYLSNDVFVSSFANVKYKNLSATEKIFVFCIKHKMFAALKVLVTIRQKYFRK